MVPSNEADALAALQGHIAHLEAELSASLEQLKHIHAGAATFERRVIAAIQACDEQRARAALLDRDDCMRDVGVLEADVHVLRALLAECRDFLSRHTIGSFDEDRGRDRTP